jgi:archaemetzincin
VLALAAGTYFLVRHNAAEEVAIERLLHDEELTGLDRRRHEVWGHYDERGEERLSPPREGEWLARFVEQGETVDEYEAHCKNRRRPGRETIALRPLGPLGARAQAALEPIRAFTAAWFGLDTKLLDVAPLPSAAYSRERDQHDVTPLLASIVKEVGDDELMHAGIADKDLSWTAHVPNYVFGGASLTERVGVYSLERFSRGDPKEPLYRGRAFKLLAHELGHILSLPHCIYYRCVMNGSNALPETDATPLHLCPVCFEKIRWNLGFDPAPRAAALAKLLREQGLEEDAARMESLGR